MDDIPTCEQLTPDLEWLNGTCPGGLSWDCCRADDCGVDGDGDGCELDRPAL